jgi:hypothetical protein
MSTLCHARYRARRARSTSAAFTLRRARARVRRQAIRFVGFSTPAVEIRLPAETGGLWPGLPLMGSGESSMEGHMKADAFRSMATWLAAMFVGSMFVAATTSFASVL